MTNKIRLLSPQVANQIAAGEVIERPASIVKELIENSLDAGSTEITLSIKNGGNNLISITDNGSGIDKVDLPLAICQHATSKLNTLTDLETIKTLGFRGEALASICSAAKLKIISKANHSTDSHAWSIEVLGDPKSYQIQPAAHPIGTSIEVRDLFFNIPVRRRFLKSHKTEYQHILEVFQKMALSHFECAFTLINDDKVIYKLPQATNRTAYDYRVKKIFGLDFLKNTFYFAGESASIKLKGWIGNRNCHRSQADQQYFFLNNRIIRDKLIIHAIKFAYQQFIPEGRQPCYVLYLDLDPSLVDVNVHPTKHEVRFCEARWVHQFIVEQLHQVLAKNLDDSNSIVVNDEDLNLFTQKNLRLSDELSAEGKNLSEIKPNNLSLSTNSNTDTLKDVATQFQSSKSLLNSMRVKAQISARSDHAIPKFNVHESATKKINSFGNIINVIDNNYAITSNSDTEVFLIDLLSAYRTLVFDKLTEQWEKNQALQACQVLIKNKIPLNKLFYLVTESSQQCVTNERLFDCLQLNTDVLVSLGFTYDITFNVDLKQQADDQYFEGVTKAGELINCVVLSAVPDACRYGNYSEIFALAINYVLSNRLDNNTNKLFEELTYLSATRLQDNFLLVEQQAILDKLAKKRYTSQHNTLNFFAKQLNARDCRKLLNQTTAD